MSNADFENYIATSADWRESLKRNTYRTYFVISLFILMYFVLGVLVDVFIASNNFPGATPSQLFLGLFTFHIIPYATGVMLAVAAISLLVTLMFHDSLMLLGTEYAEITPETARNNDELQLYHIVEEMKIAAGLGFMPKVYLIDADYMNAFASGFSEKSAMVAITKGLMQKLNRSELQAVMAHELSHIRHLDIKLTLMASLLANLILMVVDMFFYVALTNDRNSENDNRNKFVFFIYLLRYLLPLVNMMLLLYLSRTREYMADAGSVQLLRDNQPLASALLKIYNDHSTNRDRYDADYQKTPHENVRREAYIFDPAQANIKSMVSMADLFSTHPDIQSRLAAIGYKSAEKR